MGYIDLPVTAQLVRLETLLEREGMLSGGKLTPAAVEPDAATRAAITDAVDFLAYSDGSLPEWFDDSMSHGECSAKSSGSTSSGYTTTAARPTSSTGAGCTFCPNPMPYRLASMTGHCRLPGDFSRRCRYKSNRGEYAFCVAKPSDNGRQSDDKNNSRRRQYNNRAVAWRIYCTALAKICPAGSEKSTIAQSELMIRLESEEISALLTLSEVSITEHKNGERSVWKPTPSQIFVKENRSRRYSAASIQKSIDYIKLADAVLRRLIFMEKFSCSLFTSFSTVSYVGVTSLPRLVKVGEYHDGHRVFVKNYPHVVICPLYPSRICLQRGFTERTKAGIMTRRLLRVIASYMNCEKTASRHPR